MNRGSRAADRPWLPVLAWAGVVLVASVIDPPGSGGGGTAGLLAFDKVFHALGYATLAVLVARAVRPRVLRSGLLVVTGVALFGFGVEVVQWPLPFRTFSLADAAVNGLGAMVGVAVWAGYTWGQKRASR
ncbi:VanZ family protein [Haloarchaeobius sp. HME9146]|uniref:VanZ family protein n=1 Tax=Haloarchaeobius sp. HME9146 TaxID=2978732 RepID=UPI0021BEFC0B|nr:VanZ family protein [Haloarchaeobius sp. HME9146]MCT9097885.1 VanZ family protein [Haloarchaeobius sp. HME9146]